MTRVTIELPDAALATLATSPEAFGQEMRLAAAIEWYREGRVSQGKGAEIAGLSRSAFLDALSQARVPACQVTAEELDEEVARALQAHRQRVAADPAEPDRTA
jgi:predicted HTH domain antitoxin